MLSDEEKEIFNNLKDYMQSKIDNGYHKFIYNDLDWDFKCINCINAIDKVLKQSKEIEELREEKAKRQWVHIKENGEVEPLFYVSEDKIKAKIEELDKEIEAKREIARNPMDRVSGRLLTDSIVELEKTKRVLLSLLEEKE